jgi:hypothetical protein
VVTAPRRYQRTRFPVTLRTRPVTWTIRNLVGDPFIWITAESLAALMSLVNSNPIPGDRWVILERNGTLIYRGPWKGDLPDTPTLM